MIDEWCERQIDRLCAFVPAYLSPRMTRFYTTRLGWRIYLYARGFRRSVLEPFTRIQWIEKEETDLEPEGAAAEPSDPVLEGLDPQLRKQFEDWNQTQEAKKEQARKKREKLRSPQERVKLWWAGRHERARRIDEKWAAREAAADARADRLMLRARPLVEAVKKSRFVLMLLLIAVSALGVLACGGGGMGYVAAACCTMWLACAFENGYEPVSNGVRQRYLAAILLRAASFLMLLPMYFGGYIRQGVSSNVVLQSAMIVLLFAHGVFYLALIAFNGRQPRLLRVLSGILGAVPALTAAAAIALAATQMGQKMPLPLTGVIGAAGALMAFCADRLIALIELGGIRLRFAPLWINGFMEAGFMMMLFGAWMANAPL